LLKQLCFLYKIFLGVILKTRLVLIHDFNRYGQVVGSFKSWLQKTIFWESQLELLSEG